MTKVRIVRNWPAFSGRVRYIGERGPVAEAELRRTFNLGVGLAIVVARGSEAKAIASLEVSGDRAWVLGELAPTESAERVTFVGD